MKKFIILLAIPLVLACSTTFPSRPLSLDSAEQMAERNPEIDPGLLMYRHPFSRRAVETFYAGITGSGDISQAILRHANINDIPLPLAFALAWGESEYNVRALNRNPRSVDRGLFQLNSRSFPNLKAEDFYDPEISARHGLKHMRFCLNQAGSELVALAIYNAGTQKVRKGTPYSTLNHIARMLEYREQLEEKFLRAMAGQPDVSLSTL